MKKQKCVVENKIQLLAAFWAAIGYWGPTEITLNRKIGLTTYILQPNKRPLTEYHIGTDLTNYNKEIRSSIAKIRRISAECFK